MSDERTAPMVHSDQLVRNLLRLEPDALAATASWDSDARLRLGSDEPTELDGLDVVVRRALAKSVDVLSKRHATVRVLTDADANEEGWPDTRIGNLSNLFAWARSVDDRQRGAARPRLLRADARSASDEISAYDLARDWLGLDPQPHAEALGVEVDRADLSLPEAAAQAQLAWILSEALQMHQVMKDETVEAVRLKTEGDARLARHPGARASNLALLLAAGLYHARSGYTVVILPPRENFWEELATASRAFGRKHGGTFVIDDEFVVDRLMLNDACARDYVHVGRARARGVASRMVRTLWERAS